SSTRKSIASLHKVHSIEAPHRIKQQDGILWIMKALQRSGTDAARALNLYERLLGNDNIAYRNSVLSDYTHHNWDEMQLFKPSVRDDKSTTPWWAPPLQDRMKFFVESANSMAREAFASETKAPAYLIDISCTGYRAPYPLQGLLLDRGWQDQTRLLKIGHMGCYASVPSLHMGAQLARTLPADQTVSLLSTELCSLHLDPFALDLDQVVSNVLFADGCARMDMGSEPKADSLDLYAHYEAIVPDSAQYMSWDLRDGRFHMTLSRKVVTQLGRVIGHHLNEFLQRESLSQKDITRFAIHPGGPRIVESMEEELKLHPEAAQHSKDVLRKYGNMSSATLPHVWKSLSEDPTVKAGEWIISMAFGPGLTLTMNLLRKS
ncbi:MAG: 3-oxoacyl-[acyl-carrier-protein] synthase III C-terminal domain-containing protein, partial [Bdellovibrionota bacterium]